MDIDEPVDTLFPDNFDYEESDQTIIQLFSSVTQENINFSAPHILAVVADNSKGRLLSKYSHINECKDLLEKKSEVRDVILKCFEDKSFRGLRRLKLLRPEPVLEPGEHFSPPTSAVICGWEEEYRGDAADSLWAHVESWFITGSDRCFYPKYSAIVQSSGMGKSRAVDEMSRLHFVIPVILREPHSSGFPPGDRPAYDFLCHSGSQRDALIRSCSFFHALFIQTTRVVRGMSEGCAAEQFRNFMKDDMKQWFHGEERRKFYEAVGSDANGIYSVYSRYFGDNPPSGEETDGRLSSTKFPLRHALRGLCDALEAQVTRGSRQSKRQKIDTESQGPSAVLAFDEIHTLTQLGGNWSRFAEIRRAIRGLKNESLFTLFLSTSGTLFSISPTPQHPQRDSSSRMVKKGDVMLPFYQLGFDQFANKVDFSNEEKKVTISQVTSVENFASYGRPLWHLYLSSEKGQIMEFAMSKLLGGITYNGQPLSEDEKLACLAQRIPIEFLSVPYTSLMSGQEEHQVHSHMRVILGINNSLETMVTTSPSEPILSEAAYAIMTTQSPETFSPPLALQKIIKGFAVHKGELGELIVALLLTMARDKAVGPANVLGSPVRNVRWCSVTGLLASLFLTPTPSYTLSDHVNVASSHGWRFTQDGTERIQESLSEVFKDSKVYFTHFIKAHEDAIVGVEFLMHLMARGAAILCADGQANVDGIIPFLFEGDEIELDKIGVIMFQVKNDVLYTDSPRGDEVRGMNPRSAGMIRPSGEVDVPVVRLFFALAAKTATLQAVEHPLSYTTPHSYKAYDFWISGLSPNLLVPVVNQEDVWESVLQASHRWQEIYKGSLPELRRLMNPGAATDESFWKNWCEHVPQAESK